MGSCLINYSSKYPYLYLVLLQVFYFFCLNSCPDSLLYRIFFMHTFPFLSLSLSLFFSHMYEYYSCTPNCVILMSLIYSLPPFFLKIFWLFFWCQVCIFMVHVILVFFGDQSWKCVWIELILELLVKGQYFLHVFALNLALL